MNVYLVVHHSKDGYETSSTVCAESRLAASEVVSGTVMHVSQGLPVSSGTVISSHGSNLRFNTPDYPEPSLEWKGYLKQHNLAQGLEDEQEENHR